MQNKTEFVLVRKEDEAKDVVSLYFKTIDGGKYEFIAGQYVDIKPPSINGHGKSYTISSSPNDELIRITIKRKGVVSSAIMDMEIGEKIEFSGPYGNFFPEESSRDIVMLAGGIGITPFFSIINNLKSDTKNDITVICSNKTKDDIVFFDSLNKLVRSMPNLKVVHCLTQDEAVNYDDFFEFSRINEDLITKYTQLNASDYFICGSIGFVTDIWKVLKSMGLQEENIFAESFY